MWRWKVWGKEQQIKASQVRHEQKRQELMKPG